MDNEITLQQLSDKFEVLAGNYNVLQEQNKTLAEQNEELAAANKKLHGQYAELAVVAKNAVGSDGVQIDTAPPKLPAKPFFKVDKTEYEILVPSCEIPGIGYRTADEILQDEKAQKVLIKLDSAIIRKI
jgi:small-conductance mechanosensitive channel